jgi:hypothetical protein
MKTLTIEISDEDCPKLLDILATFSARIIDKNELEDIALMNAIKEGENSKTVSYSDFLQLFDEPLCN